MNLFLLTHYPFVHSDEAWLSGLSRNWLISHSITVTEPFFDLVPRSPHAIKLLFHLLQASVFSIFGYGIYQARMISLSFGVASLLLFQQVIKRFLGSDTGKKENDTIAFLFMVLLSLDPQFLASSHFARQEIALLFFLLLGLNILLSQGKGDGRREGLHKGLKMGAVVTLAIGFHPAAFLVAAALFGAILSRKRPLSRAIGFVTGCTVGGLLFMGISLIMNPGFIHDYQSFGTSVEVMVPWYIKVIRFPHYYEKLWHSYSGTYFIPMMKPLLGLHALAFALCMVKAFAGSRQARLPLFALFGFNAALLFIGKYGPPLFAIALPLFYLAWAAAPRHPLLFHRCNSARSKVFRCAGLIAMLSLIGVSTALSLTNILQEYQTGESYAVYRRNIETIVKKEEAEGRSKEKRMRLLANLNAEYALPEGSFLDYRNLIHLRESGLDFSEYIRSRGITHILYSQELDFIYEKRPVWNILYGNVAAYYGEMKGFIAAHCTPVGSFTSPGYGMRIVSQRGKRPWKITLYRVENDASVPSSGSMLLSSPVHAGAARSEQEALSGHHPD
ncbi:ArnT family glycosyltransferase [Sediminispirochaeta smaragdinae]|uniref:ArnT family glycosyltransferase n=1 Tax=Sediminispirochaeta smaragdinae TaxID=55206 RepID=UPI001FE13920|nr:glycosyltransferase family 39 protein [Sediminispirochaeta smaragdinae]